MIFISPVQMGYWGGAASWAAGPAFAAAMRSARFASVTPALVVPVALHRGLPAWCAIIAAAIIAATPVIVIQIIRLRASDRITTSHDNLKLMEIEDLPGGVSA